MSQVNLEGTRLTLGDREREQLDELCQLAAALSGTVSLQLAGDEPLMRAVARYANAQVYGLVSFEDDAPPRVCWSVAVQLDRVRVTAAICRLATRPEIQAVKKWQTSDLGRTGLLHRLVEEVEGGEERAVEERAVE